MIFFVLQPYFLHYFIVLQFFFVFLKQLLFLHFSLSFNNFVMCFCHFVKTNMPIAQQDLTPIFISPPHTSIHNHGITTITETSEDDTQKYSNKSQHR